MTYIENAFVCIAAPLLVAALCAGRRHLRPFLFSLAGMLACLLSAYVNTFFAAAVNASALDATAGIVRTETVSVRIFFVLGESFPPEMYLYL